MAGNTPEINTGTLPPAMGPTPPPADPDVLTAPEAAAYLRVHYRLMLRLAEAGLGTKVGREWRFHRAKLDAYLRGDWTPEPPLDQP